MEKNLGPVEIQQLAMVLNIDKEVVASLYDTGN